ncbi:MAG TPA: thiamine phosphate synthase [Actinomycetota bacterium]|nr:thiamine phosphate synthase [Actinomycetota bacterium]
MRSEERRARLAHARLYLVCDGRRPDLEDFLARVLEAGVDVVQLRDKEADDAELLRAGHTFRDAAARHHALFVVNDRPDLVSSLGADGVHLGQEDLSVEEARRVLGEEPLIGLSNHTPEQLNQAGPAADYVCVGPVWETPTKPGRLAAGLDLVRHAAANERRPWFAIGGIDLGNVDEVVEAGASRIVVVRAITEAPDPAAAAGSLLEALPSATV